MDTITVAEARKAEAVGKQVRLRGWVRTRRDSKGGFSFIELNDGSCQGNVQVVAPGELANYESGGQATPHRRQRRHRRRGEGIARQGAGHGSAGDRASSCSATPPAETYPLQKKGHTFEFLRTIAHLRPRTNTFGAIARLRHQVSMSIHQFFHENGFLYIHTPIITASDCEGAVRSSASPPSTPRSAAEGRGQDPTSRQRTSSASPLTSRSAGNFRSNRSPARSARSTPSAPPSAPRIRTRRATSPSSG